jgi:hypothetical protein
VATGSPVSRAWETFALFVASCQGVATWPNTHAVPAYGHVVGPYPPNVEEGLMWDDSLG